MIDELLKEINELRDYKKKYENCLIDKQTMSDELYELMMAEYERTPYEQRVEEYKKNVCNDCRFQRSCLIVLPQDIGMPIKSNSAWIPATKSCDNFEWD